MYSYPNDGFAIYLDDKMYDADHLISKIPVKEYLPLKDVYKMGLGRNPSTFDKIATAIQTPYKYVSLNMEPGFAYGHNLIKINRKALIEIQIRNKISFCTIRKADIYMSEKFTPR